MAGFLVVGLHLRGLMDALSASPSAGDYLADPGPFWLVKFMDLGIVMPGMAAIGIGILRGSKWAVKAKYAAVGWLALLGSAVAGMAIVMQLTGDPAATMANTAAFLPSRPWVSRLRSACTGSSLPEDPSPTRTSYRKDRANRREHGASRRPDLNLPTAGNLSVPSLWPGSILSHLPRYSLL